MDLIALFLPLSSGEGSSVVGPGTLGKRDRREEESLRTSGFVSLKDGLDDDLPADEECVEEEAEEEEGSLVDDGMSMLAGDV